MFHPSAKTHTAQWRHCGSAEIGIYDTYLRALVSTILQTLVLLPDPYQPVFQTPPNRQRTLHPTGEAMKDSGLIRIAKWSLGFISPGNEILGRTSECSIPLVSSRPRVSEQADVGTSSLSLKNLSSFFLFPFFFFTSACLRLSIRSR